MSHVISHIKKKNLLDFQYYKFLLQAGALWADEVGEEDLPYSWLKAKVKEASKDKEPSNVEGVTNTSTIEDLKVPDVEIIPVPELSKIKITTEFSNANKYVEVENGKNTKEYVRWMTPQPGKDVISGTPKPVAQRREDLDQEVLGTSAGKKLDLQES